MELQQRIENFLKEAMREKNETKKDAVRMLLTAMKMKEKEIKRRPGEQEIQQLIASLVKQRRDSSEQFRNAQRIDLAEKEEEEIKILQEFLPRQMTPEELDEVIGAVLSEIGAASEKDFGKVMKALMPRISGRADGKLVNELIRKKLMG